MKGENCSLTVFLLVCSVTREWKYFNGCTVLTVKRPTHRADALKMRSRRVFDAS